MAALAIPIVFGSAPKAVASETTYTVFATRLGLVGHTTANGHVIVQRDHFAALPSYKNLNPKGATTYNLRICVHGTSKCVDKVPVWEVGPWNTKDDYWNPSQVREMWKDLPQGMPEAQAAYETGYNGGKDQFGRTVLNPAAIDLADGTFWDDLRMTVNGWVDVTFNWMTVNDPPRGAIESFDCNHIVGWAYDPDASSSSINVKVFVDGVNNDTGPTSLLRPDINSAFGITGNHGFDWPLPPQWRDGRAHAVDVYAIDSQGGPNSRIGGGTFAACNDPPAGRVDTINCQIVAGSSVSDAYAPASPIGIRIAVDGTTYDAGETDDGSFAWNVPSDWWDLAHHDVTVYALDLPTGTPVSIGAGTFGRCLPVLGVEVPLDL